MRHVRQLRAHLVPRWIRRLRSRSRLLTRHPVLTAVRAFKEGTSRRPAWLPHLVSTHTVACPGPDPGLPGPPPRAGAVPHIAGNRGWGFSSDKAGFTVHILSACFLPSGSWMCSAARQWVPAPGRGYKPRPWAHEPKSGSECVGEGSRGQRVTRNHRPMRWRSESCSLAYCATENENLYILLSCR